MKKYCILLSLLLILSLAACGQAAAAPAATPTPDPTEAPAAATAEPQSAIRFSTTDRDGNTVDEGILAGHELIMLNFWEPWCPPCVGEMPDLETLYRDYADKGLLILGVYATDGMEDNVDAILEKCETSYPILHYTDAFDEFQTGYVPTTVLLNGEGEILGDALVGSRNYAAWEALILSFMKIE